MKKIYFLEPLGMPQSELKEIIEKILAEELSANKAEIKYYDDRQTDPQVLIERCAGADAVVLSNFPFPADVIKACPDLEYINVAFTGYDHVAMDQAKSQNIQVSNCRGYSTIAVAELVIGYILSFYRKLIPADQAVREEKTSKGFMGAELHGKTLGIIGLGDIGTKVAELARAFDCKVLAYNRSPRELDGVELLPLDEVLAKSDIISLHLPSNEETKHLINAEKIALMQKHAHFINLARGPIVDSEALAVALNEERIAGAYIDVFEMEPPIPTEHPLVQARNCYLTPHIGFLSQESMYRRAEIVAENLKGYLKGKLQNLVN